MSIDAVDLAYAWGSQPALTGVSLSVRPGEVLGVVGPNGCGKSTLLGLLSGALAPARGTALVGGVRLHDLPPSARAARVAHLVQRPSVSFGFTALQVVLLGRAARTKGYLDDPADVALARQWLAAVGGAETANRPIDRLSGGERQRAFLALALAQGAPVLLLDEPTAHLDPGQALDVLERVAAETRTARLTTVVVLHDLNLAAQLCDRVALLEAGRVVGLGAPLEVLTPENLGRVYGLRVSVAPHPERGGTTVLPLRR